MHCLIIALVIFLVLLIINWKTCDSSVGWEQPARSNTANNYTKHMNVCSSVKTYLCDTSNTTVGMEKQRYLTR